MQETTSHFSAANLLRLSIVVIGIIVMAAAPYWAGRADVRLFGEFFSFLAPPFTRLT